MKVDRYRIFIDSELGYHSIDWEEDKNGKWCRADDVEELEEEYIKLQETDEKQAQIIREFMRSLSTSAAESPPSWTPSSPTKV